MNCVDEDIKPYSLTHPHTLADTDLYITFSDARWRVFKYQNLNYVALK